MRDEEKQNIGDELSQVKSLIGQAKGEDYALDDILAEFGQGPGPRPKGAKRPRPEGKVVAFPGAATLPAQEAPPAPAQDSGGPAEQGAPPAGGETDRAQVIPFPEEESVLSAFLKDLSKKADDYADHMYEEDEATDPEEVRRLEELIPGTDQEEVQPPSAPSRWHRPRREDPPPPDASPQKLFLRYSKGLSAMWLRSWFLMLLSLLGLFQALVPALGFTWQPPLDAPAAQAWICAALLGTGILLGGDVVLTGLIRAFQAKVGMDTLTALACLFTLADSVCAALSRQPESRLPYGAVCLAGLYFQLRGSYHKRLALRLSCRTAAAAAHPYRVTLDEGKWSGRDTYTKWQGSAEGFGSQIQADDGAQLLFRRVCPLLLLGDVLLAVLASVGAGAPGRLLWALSALFTVSAAFGGALAYGRSFHKTARRLAQSGAALAGWPGVAGGRNGGRVLVTDTDLFPPGHVELNGYKVMKDFPAERVVAYTATLILDSGSGLGKVFHDQLRAMGGLLRKADRLTCYEGGGLGANIRGEQVLVGSASFMNLMEIPLPQGLNVKNAVFCAIDGALAGIFALSYTLPDTVFPALEMLMLEKIGPVLATRDFNLIPAMLQQRFKLAADKMDFPPVERRRELSDPEQSHSGTLTALLCREGLLPFAEAAVAAKRLRWATRAGAALCCAGSVLGMALAAYLVSVGAYTSLSPLNLLLYLLSWLSPVWLLSSWSHRF